MESRLPATRITVHQQKLFAANQKKAALRTETDSCEEKTVDEMMLDASFLFLSSAGSSRIPSFSGLEQSSNEHEASSADGFSPNEEAESHGKGSDHHLGPVNTRQGEACSASRDAMQENWRLLRKFITDRQFYPPKRGHFATLLSSPRSRDIVTRPRVRFVADQPKKVRLLMVHMTGEEPFVPCDSCALGRGPFKKCVTISKKAAGETTNGIVCCTNCASKRSLQLSCNAEELLSQPPAGQVGPQQKQRKKHVAPEPREHASPVISSRSTKVDSRFTFEVHVLPLDGSLELDPKPSSIRLCSLASGKVMVQLEGTSPFLIGTHGMFKLMPAMSAQVSNASEADSVLHVSTVKS